MARDDFNQRTTDLLMKQVAGACSRPTCDVQTVGPAPRLAPERLSNVGTAAHISAASPGGPRYDPSLTPAERRSANNGIWLCATCARDIDNDAESYPVELLRTWKAAALQKALTRHRKPFLTDATVEERIAAAFKASPSAQAPRAIRNAIVAADAHLSSLDPRLAVSTSFVGGAVHHEIRAKEPVDFGVTVTGADPALTGREFRKLLEEGQPASIPASSMKLFGSELLEELTANIGEGVLHLVPVSRPVTLRLALLEGPRRVQTEVAVVEGAATAGTKALHLSGSLWGGLLEVSIRSEIVNGECGDSVLSLTPNLEFWDGKDIRLLPHFEEIRAFASKAFGGASVQVEAHVQGQPLFHSVTDLPVEGLLRTLGIALDYVHLARELARRYEWGVQFRPRFTYHIEDHQRLADAFHVVTGARDELDLGNKPLLIEATFSDSVQVTEETDLGSLRFEAGAGCRVPVFDWLIELPPPVLEVTGKGEARRRVYKAGKKVTFKFDPRKHPVTLKWTLGKDGAIPTIQPRLDPIDPPVPQGQP